MEYVDYLRPIIADADTGYAILHFPLEYGLIFGAFRHGGLSAVMKLVKLFAESVNSSPNLIEFALLKADIGCICNTP